MCTRQRVCVGSRVLRMLVTCVCGCVDVWMCGCATAVGTSGPADAERPAGVHASAAVHAASGPCECGHCHCCVPLPLLCAVHRPCRPAAWMSLRVGVGAWVCSALLALLRDCVRACVPVCVNAQLLQRYEIDMCLKRYPSALRNLIGILQAAPAGAASAVDVAAVGVAMSPFAERVPPPSADMCMQLATEHGLQLEAATALQDPRWSDVRRRLLVSHGQVLVAAGKVDQALVVFMSCTPPARSALLLLFLLFLLLLLLLVIVVVVVGTMLPVSTAACACVTLHSAVAC